VLDPPAPSATLSVVIPTLDEQARIGRRLSELAALPGVREVIVVDGGSSDGTAAAVACHPGVRWLQAPRGRASQMNAGAALALGEVHLFLHADVRLPPDAALHIQRALRDPAVVAGAFRTWTVPDTRPTWLSPLLHLADLRSRCARLPYGDQAIFVRSQVFRDVGGFPDLPILEDLELSRRLWTRGRMHTCSARVEVSGRRFLARPVFYTVLVNLIPLLVRLGVRPARLAALYGAPR